MSVRAFAPTQVLAAAAALGSAAGRTFQINNNGWAILLPTVLTYVASATAGTRNPVLQLLDAANNLLWHTMSSAASTITAGTTTRLFFAGLTQVIAPAGGGLMVYQLPDGMSLPPNSKLIVFDGSNIDVNDTLQLNSLIFSL
ncbi:MAG TPA: hypothetical protein VF748_17440 [Candidatus Acidoferrum sp.]